jgi:hypothetical protein
LGFILERGPLQLFEPNSFFLFLSRTYQYLSFWSAVPVNLPSSLQTPAGEPGKKGKRGGGKKKKDKAETPAAQSQNAGTPGAYNQLTPNAYSAPTPGMATGQWNLLFVPP